MNLYKSERLDMLIKRWVNLERITKLDYTTQNNKYKTAYKKLITTLSNQDSKLFEFNNASIKYTLDILFNIS